MMRLFLTKILSNIIDIFNNCYRFIKWYSLPLFVCLFIIIDVVLAILACILPTQ